MNGRERIKAVLQGQLPDVCPAAPIFWGAEYVWKVTGRTLLDQLFGPDPGAFDAALALYRRHRADWVLLTTTDGNGWLAGKTVEERDGRTLIHDPADGADYVFDPAGHTLRRLGGPNPVLAEQDASGAHSRDAVRALFPEEIHAPGEDFRRRLEHLRQETGGAVFLCGSVISPFVDACYRLGARQAMVQLIDEPELFRYAADCSLERQRAIVAGLRGLPLDGVLIAESYASCDMISPEHYRRFALPYQRAMVDALHDAGLPAVVFSTGNLLPILADMRCLKADGLVVEEGRKGAAMDIGDVRREYGSGCLFGNVSAERLLVTGDLDTIRREALRQIEAAGMEGTFAASNGGSPVCDDTPPEAVDALIGAAHEYRYG